MTGESGGPGVVDYLLEEVLPDTQLTPGEFQSLTKDAKEAINGFGNDDKYLVLGSYETPYFDRVRTLEQAIDAQEGANAFVLEDMPSPSYSHLPELKIKFHLYAQIADVIVPVIEHQSGGVIQELGTLARPDLKRCVFVAPRCPEEKYNGPIRSTLTAKARAMETAYDHLEVNESVDEIVARARGVDITTKELESYIEQQLGRRDHIHLSWVTIDEYKDYYRSKRIYPWHVEEELSLVGKTIVEDSKHLIYDQ